MSEDEATSTRCESRGAATLSDDDYRRLLRVVASRLERAKVPREVARDLAQETLLRAWKKRHTFKGDSSLDTWVIGISKKVLLQHQRYHGQEKRDAEEVELVDDLAKPVDQLFPGSTPAADPEQRTIYRAQIAWAKQQIAGLPGEMRLALELRTDGHAYREIARILRVPVTQVSSLLHQARLKLRKDDPDRSKDPPS